MRYLLCIIPPLAVLSCGKAGQFLVSIGLTLCFYVPGFLHALGVVHNYYADKRTDRIVNAISKSVPGSGVAAQPQTAKGGFGSLMKFFIGASLFGAVVVGLSNKTHIHADKSASVEQAKSVPASASMPVPKLIYDYLTKKKATMATSREADLIEMFAAYNRGDKNKEDKRAFETLGALVASKRAFPLEFNKRVRIVEAHPKKILKPSTNPGVTPPTTSVQIEFEHTHQRVWTDSDALSKADVPKPDDKLLPYTIISEDTDATIWRNVRVRLQEKGSEDDLKRILENVKSTESKKFNSTEVSYYLSDTTSEIGPWARATLKSKDPFKADPNPKLEISIFGNPKGVLPPKPDGEIIGQWEDYTLARTFETLCRTKDGLKMSSTSGETGKTISSELVTAKKEGNRIIIRPIKKADDNSDYWILDEAKNLLFMDSQGNTGKAIAIIKPTLTP